MEDQSSSPPSFVPTHGFSGIAEGILKWYCPPPPATDDDTDTTKIDKNGWWKVTDDDDSSSTTLLLAPPAKHDFWRKTYYQPLLVKDDGPFLYRSISQNTLPITIHTTFEVQNPQSQFDQGGIMIRLDYEHWIKTGVEVVDNIPRLSCVVTNGFSDWSTQIIDNPKIKIRVHVLPQHGGSIVVEAAAPIVGDTTDKWSFIRIAHLNKNMNHDMLNDTMEVQNAVVKQQQQQQDSNSIMCGLFGACPVDQQGTTTIKFYDFSITQGSTFVHDA